MDDLKVPVKLELMLIQEECALPVLKSIKAIFPYGKTAEKDFRPDIGFRTREEEYPLREENKIILLTRPERVCLLNDCCSGTSVYKKTLEVGHAIHEKHRPTIYVVYELIKEKEEN